MRGRLDNMEINETFVRTSKNYSVNSFSVPDKTFDVEHKTFSGFTTNYNGVLRTNKKLPLSPLCEKAKKEIENANISVKINIDKNYQAPVILNFDFANDDYLVDSIKIHLEEGIKANLILNYKSNKKIYHNGFISIECEKDSAISCVMIFDLSKDSDNFISLENAVKENANLNFTMIDFSGNYSVSRYITDLIGDNATSDLKTMYISDKDSKIDLNYAQNIFGKNSNATIKTVGALQGNSTKNFKGIIDFKRGSTKSIGNEEELCLLLSKIAKSKALPLLCCSEEDVSGSHSSATGKIGEKELFYIMSRGLNKTEGLKLLLKAKFSKILDDLFDSELIKEINKRIDEKIIDEKSK